MEGDVVYLVSSKINNPESWDINNATVQRIKGEAGVYVKEADKPELFISNTMIGRVIFFNFDEAKAEVENRKSNRSI